VPPLAINIAKPYARLLIPEDEKNPNPKSKYLLSIRASVKNSLGASYPEEYDILNSTSFNIAYPPIRY
jgi:hypothetical protein